MRRAAWLVLLCGLAGCIRARPFARHAPRVHAAAMQGRWAEVVSGVRGLFRRFNLDPPTSGRLNVVIARQARTLRKLLPQAPPAAMGGLVLLLVGYRLSRATAERDLPLAGPGAAGALAELHAVGIAHELAQRHPPLGRLLRVTVSHVLSSPQRRQLPRVVRRMVARLRRRGTPPLGVLWSRAFPRTFDRERTRVLLATSRARACTLRTVEAPAGTLSTVTARGDLIVAGAGAVREAPASGAIHQTVLAGTLPAGSIVHDGEDLWHLRATPEGLLVRPLRSDGRAYRVGQALLVPGPGYLETAGVLRPGILLVFRKGTGYTLVRLDAKRGSATPMGRLPGATGHRDGRLGPARFMPGPLGRLRDSAMIFFDPAARALRVLKRGWVATAVLGRRRRDGAPPRVGRVTGVAVRGERIYLAEASLARASTGASRHHLRVLRLDGGPCR